MGKPGPTQPELVTRVSELTAQGHTVPHIAHVLHLSERTVQRYRHLTGCAVAPPPKITDEELARGKAMLDDGASYVEVGRTLGRSPKCFSRRFPGYTWTLSECAQLGQAIRWARYREN